VDLNHLLGVASPLGLRFNRRLKRFLVSRKTILTQIIAPSITAASHKLFARKNHVRYFVADLILIVSRPGDLTDHIRDSLTLIFLDLFHYLARQ
jgi:hypothetical protein